MLNMDSQPGAVLSTEKEGRSDLDRQLLDAVARVSGAADFPAALSALLEAARALLPCDGSSAMWLVGDQLEVLASQGELVPLPGLTLPIVQLGAARLALDSGRPALVADTTRDPRWRCPPGEEQALSWLAAPLAVDGRPLGLLEWTSGEAHWFEPEDAQAAALLARHVAPLLHHFQLLDDTRHRLRQALEPRLSRPARSPDVGGALEQLTREAMEMAGVRHAFAFLVEEGSRRLRCVAASGELRDAIRNVVLRGDGTLGGWRMAAGHGAERAGDWIGTGPSDREIMSRLGLAESFILPLRGGREQIGMLGVAGPYDDRPFSQATLRVLAHLASQASLIVERLHHSRSPSDGYDYEMIFQCSPLGLCVLSVAGEIQVCNPALATLLARSDRNLAGRSLSDFLTAGDWRRLSRALEEVSVSGHRQQEDTLIQSAQGEQRHVRLTMAPVPAGQAMGDRDKLATSLVAVVEDVTWLKLLEQERIEHLRELREKHSQLQDLDQRRTRFVSNVSHELLTPLAVIKLYATLARKGRPEKQTYYLQTIEQETHRLETMVENILDLTRIDRQALRLHPEPVAAEEIIAQVLEVYQETAQKRGIELKNHVPGQLPPLSADKNDLIQMLTNLVDNGLKYTPRGGQVWVAAREIGTESQPMLEIAIGDTGIGIAPAEQSKVFERFYRGSNNTAGSTGTGLGLAIIQELMTQHGGRVTLKSQVGQGSVFALQFPLTRPEGQEKEPEQ